jgi:hypothetical protein
LQPFSAVKDVAVMTEEHAPNEAAMKIAEEGIRGMINALGAEAIAPEAMIEGGVAHPRCMGRVESD